jgi:hypothetical protein
MQDETGKIITSKEFTPPAHLKGLFQYLLDNDKFEDIKNYDKSLLKIHTDSVLKMIQNGESGWEEFVPASVATLIKENCLFGYPCEITGV